MATKPDIQTEDMERAQPGGSALPLPGGGEELGARGGVPANVVQLYMSQCVEGGWERDTADGRTMPVNTTFNYIVNLEFESADKAKAFMARDDLDQISNTMTRTMESMAHETLGLEIVRDFLPESYPDKQIPDDVHRQFTPNTIMDMNIVAGDFVNVMRATYPDIGLVRASVDEGSVNQLPGCYYGVPDDLAHAPAADEDQTIGAGLRNSGRTYSF
ncbi:MAG: hypothetical protein KDI65_09810 [Alphaproteobacteria bacterium]|nr:hypothetical protein [Alphaproteobacteria bacterium]